ncbi:MAG: membrane protein insertion efficiency factor YidD [Chitinispirillaceae bacterium]
MNETVKTESRVPSDAYGSGENWLLNLYQKYISPIRGENICPMYPSCSQYAKLAFNNQNPFNAFISTCSRLLSCGHDLHTYPTITKDGRLKYFDPALENSSGFDETHTETQTEPLVIEKEEDIATLFKEYADYNASSNNWTKAFEYYSLSYFASSSDSLRQALIHSLVKSSYWAHPHHRFKQVFYQYHDSMNRRSLSKCGLYLAKSYFLSGYYSKAFKTAEMYGTLDSSSVDPYGYHFIKGLSCLGQKKEDMARSAFDSSALQGLSVGNTDFERAKEQLSHAKSPAVAGILSAVLPGSGYLYADKPSTALTSFIVNGLFIWSAVEMFSDRKYAVGSTISFIGIGWYLGNIQGSVRSAVSYNEVLEQSVLRNLARKAGFDW